jgi:transcriptional regulator GlxA family with amidase domain
MTMSRYVRDLRVMRAGELLLRTSQPLSAIAMSSGFVDHVHLARAFRTCIGVCPTDLRRQVHGRQVA